MKGSLSPHLLFMGNGDIIPPRAATQTELTSRKSLTCLAGVNGPSKVVASTTIVSILYFLLGYVVIAGKLGLKSVK